MCCGGGGGASAETPKLTYDSQIGLNRITGNWWFPWDTYVVPQQNGDLKYYEQGRAGDVYTWDAVNQVYVSPPGYFDVMVQNQDGTWTRTDKVGHKWHFNTAGYLDWTQSRHGLQITVNRDPQNLIKILSIVDFANRTLTVNYNANGYVSSLVDWGGRTTSFTYTAQGYLATITYPPTTFYDRNVPGLVTRGRVVTLQYQTNTGNSNLDGNLTTKIDDRGNNILSLAYDNSDRVTSINARGGQWTFQYGTSTTVTDPDGVTTAYSFNANGAIVRKEIFTRTGLGQTPLRQGEPNSYVWQYVRTAPCNCDLITQITNPDGSTIGRAYDVWGNLTSHTSTPPSGSSLPVRTETWTWSGFAQFCRMLTHTTASGNAPGATAADYTTTWTHNATGDPIGVTFPLATINGTLVHPTASAAFNSAGRPTAITFPNGTVYSYSYDPNTLDLLQVTQDTATGGLGLVTQYGYDTYSRLTSLTDPRGNTATIQYNALDQVTQIQKPGNGGRTRNTFDNNNQIYMVEVENLDAQGNQVTGNPWFTTTRAYDANDRLVSETVEIDSTTTATTQYVYTSAGRLWKATNPVGNVTAMVYDERGLVFQQTEGFGTSVAGTTTLNYTLNGNLASVVNPRGYTTSVASDYDGWMWGKTDPSGCAEAYSYDLDGQLLQSESRNAQGVAIARKSYSYDPYGLLLSSQRHLLDSSGNTTQAFMTSYSWNATPQASVVTDAMGSQTIFTYDSLGRLSQVLDAAGNKVTFALDGNANVTTRTLLAWNQVTSAYDTLVFDYAYDAVDRRTQATRRDSGNTTSTASQWAYDSRGNVTDATDEVGNTRHFGYDGRSLLTTTTLDLRAGGVGSGAVTGTIVDQVAYDLAGRITSRKDGLNQQTTYAYDARNRLVSETNAANGVRSLTYDANGNVITLTDPVGNVVTNTYDNRDHLTARAITRASGVLGTTSESYAYDALGRRLSAVDDDSTVQYTYDTLGRTLTETEGPNPLGSSGKTFTYSYNSVGSMVTVAFPDGTVENRGRDTIQRLSSVAIQGGPTLASYQYAGGRVINLGLQNGVTRINTFDALWRETLVEYRGGSTSLRKFEYVLNPADYRLLEKRHHAGGTGDNYTLDSLYRTVNVKEGVADPVAEYQNPGSQTFLTTKTPAYDAAQNRTQVAVTPSGGSTTTTSYTADALNFYTSVGSVACIRDANGNLRDDGTRTYEYDFKNQLCRVTDKATSAVIASFDYDALGRRIAKATATRTVSYFWTFEAMAMEFDASGQFSRRHYGSQVDEVVSAFQRDLADLNNNGSTSDSVWLTPAYDGSRDCAAVIGPTGAVAESYVHAYDGGVTVFSGAGQQLSVSALGWSQGYGGMARDDETGLLYARLRYYSPSIGRWLTRDPIGVWGDRDNLGNGVAWVGNHYRNAVDPFGLEDRRSEVRAAVGGLWDYNGFVEQSMDKIEASGIYSGYHATSWADAVNKALARVDCKCQCVDFLVIVSHGTPGSVNLSAGANGHITAGTFMSPSAEDAAATQKLKDCLCPNALVLLWSCSIAYKENAMPQVMANALGAEVVAATGTVTSADSVGMAATSGDDDPQWRHYRP